MGKSALFPRGLKAMQLNTIKMTIPRQNMKSDCHVTVEVMPEKQDKPVHKVLVAMLGRLYYNERKVNTS